MRNWCGMKVMSTDAILKHSRTPVSGAGLPSSLVQNESARGFCACLLTFCALRCSRASRPPPTETSTTRHTARPRALIEHLRRQLVRRRRWRQRRRTDDSSKSSRTRTDRRAGLAAERRSMRFEQGSRGREGETVGWSADMSLQTNQDVSI